MHLQYIEHSRGALTINLLSLLYTTNSVLFNNKLKMEKKLHIWNKNVTINVRVNALTDPSFWFYM